MKQIHCIGIKGVGVAPLAIIAKQAGFSVSGCDTNESFITDQQLGKEGIVPLVGFSPHHIRSIDMVITTGAHGGAKDEEIAYAKQLGIPVLSQGEAVGMFMKGDIFQKNFVGISVAGCHGKTTTTAMLATMLRINEMDPTFVIGTGVGHFGKGKYFIAEADEYATDPAKDKTPKFLWQYPQILIITNIEFDHPDIYASLDAVSNAYKKLLQNITPDGLLIINGDDSSCRKIVDKYTKKIITFGLNLDNDYVLSNVTIKNNATEFLVHNHGELVGSFSTPAIGVHNAGNALAAIIVGKEIGFSTQEIHAGIRAFTGTKRRLEFIGTLKSGALVYDDYAHHPTEIQKTLLALKTQFPSKKIVCIFQPHTFSRTKILFDQFLHSFESADTVIITDIFASKRETVDTHVSSKLLVDALGKVHKDVLYFSDIPGVVGLLQQAKLDDANIIITMGAGDIYTVDSQLVFKDK